MIFAILFCLLASGFFSGVEMGLISLNKFKLRHKIEAKNKKAFIVGKLLDTPEKILSTTLVGTNIFIGHGKSEIWKDLKDFIQDRLKLPWDEFNRVPVAGITNIARLSSMLDESAFAFIVFTGVMDYFANEDGVRWFCKKILPEIRTSFPGAQFFIVGNKPTRTVKKLAQLYDGDVSVTSVPDKGSTFIVEIQEAKENAD